MKKQVQVWTIYYKVRINSNDSWRLHEWVGPCGVGITTRVGLSSFDFDCLSGRPFFFRTRALARQRAKELSSETNKIWVWCKHTVQPLILSWSERNQNEIK